MKRTPKQWQQYASTHIKAGYVPGGDVSKFYHHGVRLKKYIEEHAGVDFKNLHVLDLGCGNGRLAMALSDVEGLQYTGIDVVQGSIQFCARAFAEYPNFRFYHSPVYNSRYASQQKVDAEKYYFPFDLESFNIAIANSFFTHTGTVGNAQHYLDRLHDVLRPGGLLYSTWFRNPPHMVSDDHARTVYKERDIIEMIEQKFTIEKEWGGTTKRNRDQWRILARKI